MTTVNSAVQSKLPAPFCAEKITILEYLYQCCDLSFVDEADRAQNVLDSTFCSQLSIFGTKKSLYHLQTNENFPQKLEFEINPIKSDCKEIKELLEYTIAEEKLFNHNLYRQLVRGRLLWQDLFDQLLNYSISDKYALDKNEELNTYYQNLRKSFMQTFDSFAKKIYQERGFSEQLYQLWKNIASEYRHYEEDLNAFVNLKVKEFFASDESEIAMNVIKKFSSLSKNWEKPLKEAVDKIKPKVILLTRLFMIEARLNFILRNWQQMQSLIESPLNNELWFLNSLKREFAGLMPKPHGLNYGFQLEKRTENKSFKINYRNYEGVGRWLLLNFHKLYRDTNKNKSNVVLLSGTSKFEKSPQYHLQLPTDLLITTKQEENSELKMNFPQNIAVKISGTDNFEKDKNFAQLVSLLHETDSIYQHGNYINTQLNKLQNSERKRAIFAVGSYQESDLLAEHLLDSNERTKALVRPEEKKKDYHLPRNKIEKTPELGVKYLTVPLGVGRGYNIMIEVDDQFMAGFNTIVFAKRPYYIPYDINTMVTWVNQSYIEILNQYKVGKIKNVQSLKKILNKETKKAQRNFESMYGYASLSDEQREKLLADTLVDVYQFACRAIRGNSKAVIILADSSFAPKTIQGKADDERTSMIIGWRKMLEKLLNHSNPVQRKIYRELYQILLDGLEMIEVEENSREG